MTTPAFGFQLSIHAINRLYERHPDIFSNPALFQPNQGRLRREVAYKVLDDSVEYNAAKNNTAFMAFLWEKHGFDKNYTFFVNNDVLFIGATDMEGLKVIVTTLSCEQHRLPHFQNARFTREDRFTKDSAPVRYRKTFLGR